MGSLHAPPEAAFSLVTWEEVLLGCVAEGLALVNGALISPQAPAREGGVRLAVRDRVMLHRKPRGGHQRPRNEQTVKRQDTKPIRRHLLVPTHQERAVREMEETVPAPAGSAQP